MNSQNNWGGISEGDESVIVIRPGNDDALLLEFDFINFWARAATWKVLNVRRCLGHLSQITLEDLTQSDYVWAPANGLGELASPGHTSVLFLWLGGPQQVWGMARASQGTLLKSQILLEKQQSEMFAQVFCDGIALMCVFKWDYNTSLRYVCPCVQFIGNH